MVCRKAIHDRVGITKSDWILWSATLAEKRPDFQKLLAPVWQYVHETPSRVPLSDWHFPSTGKYRAFIARSVGGGFFLPMLASTSCCR